MKTTPLQMMKEPGKIVAPRDTIVDSLTRSQYADTLKRLGLELKRIMTTARHRIDLALRSRNAIENGGIPVSTI